MVLSSLSGIGRLAMILVLTFLWVGNLGVFSAFFFFCFLVICLRGLSLDFHTNARERAYELRKHETN